LKLNYDKLLASSAFNFNLRHYVMTFVAARCSSGGGSVVMVQGPGAREEADGTAAEAAVDVLCAMASSSDACKAAVVRHGTAVQTDPRLTRGRPTALGFSA